MTVLFPFHFSHFTPPRNTPSGVISVKNVSIETRGIVGALMIRSGGRFASRGTIGHLRKFQHSPRAVLERKSQEPSRGQTPRLEVSYAAVNACQAQGRMVNTFLSLPAPTGIFSKCLFSHSGEALAVALFQLSSSASLTPRERFEPL